MSEQSLRLLAAIEYSGLSYAELEKRTKIPKSSIQRYARGITKKIPVDAVKQIAEATGSSAAWIMGWVTDEKVEKKNDIISDIILRLRTDKNFMEVVTDLYNISDKQLTAVKTMLDALKE